MSRVDDAKEVPMTQVLENLLRLTPASQGGTPLYRCPFHNDVNHPSLVVYTQRNTCRCLAGCQISDNGNPYASTIDVVMKAYNISLQDAVTMLVGESSWSPPKKKERTAPTPKSDRFFNNILTATKTIHRAETYLRERRIGMPFAQRVKLGAITYQSKEFITTPKHILPSLPAQRIIVPYLRGGNVYSFVSRLDMMDARMLLMSMDEVYWQAAEEAGYTEWEDVAAFVFGSRYRSYPLSTSNTLYMEELFRRQRDGKIIQPHFEVAFLMEGQFDVLSMIEHGKLPAGATAGYNKVPEITSNVETIIWVLDADPLTVDTVTGEVTSPALRVCDRVRTLCGRTEGVNWLSVYPASGCKDVNDMAKAGVLQDWLTEIGMDGVRRLRL